MSSVEGAACRTIVKEREKNSRNKEYLRLDEWHAHASSLTFTTFT